MSLILRCARRWNSFFLISRAFGWLYENHPRTAISNLAQLVEPVCIINKKGHMAPHGYWKDLLNIVALAATGELGPRDRPAFFLWPALFSMASMRIRTRIAVWFHSPASACKIDR